jgi:hypothetical protein
MDILVILVMEVFMKKKLTRDEAMQDEMQSALMGQTPKSDTMSKKDRNIKDTFINIDTSRMDNLAKADKEHQAQMQARNKERGKGF